VRLVEHINVINQDVKSRRLAGLIEKIAHFQIGNQFVPSLISGWTLANLNAVELTGGYCGVFG
jgi:hypothetical protein